MEEGFDAGGDSGSHFDADLGGELCSNAGADSDINNIDVDLGGDVGHDLNTDGYGDNIDDGLGTDANMDETIGDDSSADYAPELGEDLNAGADRDLTETDSDLGVNSVEVAELDTTAGVGMDLNNGADDTSGIGVEYSADGINEETVNEFPGIEQEELDNSEIYSDMADNGDSVEDDAFSKEAEDIQQFDIDEQGDELEKKEDNEDGGPSDEGKESTKEFTENPYNEDGSLKPNIEYTTGEYDYHYETDDHGRITSFFTNDLQLTEREERLPHNSHSSGKGEFDDAGHLIGDRFGGSPELDNLVSQASNINRGDYKAMENDWAEALRNGNHVEVTGDISYDGDNPRPSSFDTFYTIDGEMYERSFLNRRC